MQMHSAQAGKDLYYFCIKHSATVQYALKEPITTAADDNFDFLIFQRKWVLTFHVNLLYFSKKKYNVVCCKFCLALSVQCVLKFQFFIPFFNFFMCFIKYIVEWETVQILIMKVGSNLVWVCTVLHIPFFTRAGVKHIRTIIVLCIMV